MKEVRINTVIYRDKTQQINVGLREEIVKEVRRLGYIVLSCRGISAKIVSYLSDEAIGIEEISPGRFILLDWSEQTVFCLIKDSPHSSEELADRIQTRFKNDFGSDSAVSHIVKVIDL